MLHVNDQDTEAIGFRVLIVEDHPLYGDAMARALSVKFTDCTSRTALTLKQAFETLDEGFVPDLVLFDLKLPDVKGISGFSTLRARIPNARILVISSLASYDLVQSLLEEGANGFLPKDASVDRLQYVVKEVMAGRSYVPKEYRASTKPGDAPESAFETTPELSALTPQQLRILKLICVGKPNKQIAYELSLAEATVKAHITALLRRLGVQNRTQAVVLAESAMVRSAGSEPEARNFLNH